MNTLIFVNGAMTGCYNREKFINYSSLCLCMHIINAVCC
jgi:hypothetical protein